MDTGNLGYEEAALKNDLRDWWDKEVQANAGPLGSGKLPAGTIFDAVPEMDSLSALKGLMTVEEHVPFEVPCTVIRRGGYHGFDDMCGDILPKVRALAREHAARAVQKVAPQSTKNKPMRASHE